MWLCLHGHLQPSFSSEMPSPSCPRLRAPCAALRTSTLPRRSLTKSECGSWLRAARSGATRRVYTPTTLVRRSSPEISGVSGVQFWSIAVSARRDRMGRIDRMVAEERIASSLVVEHRGARWGGFLCFALRPMSTVVAGAASAGRTSSPSACYASRLAIRARRTRTRTRIPSPRCAESCSSPYPSPSAIAASSPRASLRCVPTSMPVFQVQRSHTLQECGAGVERHVCVTH
jgi:hypothetical protein